MPVVLAASIFLLDLAMPLGYASGVLYVGLVVASLWLPWSGAPFVAAGTGTVLTMLGALLSPDASDPTVYLANRSMSIMAIWAAALASYWPRRLQEENRRTEERFRYLAESAQIILYTAPVDCMRMGYIDRRIEKMLGYPVKAWLQDGFWESKLHPEDRERVLRTDYMMRTLGGDNESEYRMIAADGRVVWLRDVARVTRGPMGKPEYFGFLTDITEARLRDRQMAETEKMKAVGQLAGGLAHDFNNLLAVIVANLELIEDQVEVGSRLERPVRNAMLAAQSGASVTQRLLAFAGRQPSEPSPVDLNQLVVGMLDLLAHALGDRITIDTRLEEDLWTVRLDAGQFEAALLNLAMNARDAMAEGGRLRIEIRNVALAAGVDEGGVSLPPGQYALLEVTDTGEGMSPEVLAKALEPFFSTKGPGRGTGLGLSMVNTFVGSFGGKLLLQSQPGVGTTARLYFPRAADLPSEAKAVAPCDDGGIPDPDSAPAGGLRVRLAANDASREEERLSGERRCPARPSTA